MKISIYFLSDPRSPRVIRYVGQTSFDLPLRLCRHVKDAKGGSHLPRNKWIRSLLRSGLSPRITLIAFADRKTAADVLEEFHIKANWGNLLNVARRACGVAKHTRKTRRKMAMAKLGRKQTALHRAHIALANKKSWSDPLIRAARIKGLTGLRRSKAARAKMSERAQGRIISAKQRRDISAGLKAWYADNPQTTETRSRRASAVRKAWTNKRLRREAAQRSKKRWSDPEFRRRMLGGAS